ncbi:MAG: hypothetical protein WBA25_14500 [Jannaschia sp.]
MDEVLLEGGVAVAEIGIGAQRVADGDLGAAVEILPAVEMQVVYPHVAVAQADEEPRGLP